MAKKTVKKPRETKTAKQAENKARGPEGTKRRR